MDPRFAFFSSRGRLGPRAFGQALILLTGTMMILQILVALVSPGFGLLQYALVYPYVCVFGKRLHDAGYSAWLWLALVIAYFVLSSIVSAILLPLLSPAAFAMQVEFQKLAEAGDLGAAVDALVEKAPDIARASVLTTVAGFLVVSGIIGVPVFRLHSDKGNNKYGPPPDDAARARQTFS